jgi:hypothetical protein
MIGGRAIHTLIDDLNPRFPPMFDVQRADIISKKRPSSSKLDAYKTTLSNFILLSDPPADTAPE